MGCKWPLGWDLATPGLDKQLYNYPNPGGMPLLPYHKRYKMENLKMIFFVVKKKNAYFLCQLNKTEMGKEKNNTSVPYS